MAKNYKTIALTGTEQKVALAGQNCDIRNDSADILYASADAGITSGADGVLSVPAGQAAQLRDSNGAIYLLGTGSVLLCGHDDNELVFKSAASANGGGGMASGAVINPPINLNPDFSVNQRGQTEYTGIGCNVDCWMGAVTFAKITVGDGIKCEVTADVSGSQLIFYQPYKGDVSSLIGRTVTVSAKVMDVLVSGRFVINARFGAGDDNDSYVASASIPVTAAGVFSASVTVPETARTLRFEVGAVGAAAGNYVHAGFIKAEVGAATPLVIDPTTELMKCQRYYQVRSTGDINFVDLRPSMVTITDIKQREDGNFEYVAEL